MQGENEPNSNLSNIRTSDLLMELAKRCPQGQSSSLFNGLLRLIEQEIPGSSVSQPRDSSIVLKNSPETRADQDWIKLIKASKTRYFWNYILSCEWVDIEEKLASDPINMVSKERTNIRDTAAEIATGIDSAYTERREYSSTNGILVIGPEITPDSALGKIYRLKEPHKSFCYTMPYNYSGQIDQRMGFHTLKVGFTLPTKSADEFQRTLLDNPNIIETIAQDTMAIYTRVQKIDYMHLRTQLTQLYIVDASNGFQTGSANRAVTGDYSSQKIRPLTVTTKA